MIVCAGGSCQEKDELYLVLRKHADTQYWDRLISMFRPLVLFSYQTNFCEAQCC